MYHALICLVSVGTENGNPSFYSLPITKHLPSKYMVMLFNW